jgi:hypothetical protein
MALAKKNCFIVHHIHVKDVPQTRFHHPNPNVSKWLVDVLVAIIVKFTRHLREPPKVQALACNPQNAVRARLGLIEREKSEQRTSTNGRWNN